MLTVSQDVASVTVFNPDMQCGGISVSASSALRLGNLGLAPSEPLFSPHAYVVIF